MPIKNGRYHGLNPIMITSKREHRASRLTTLRADYSPISDLKLTGTAMCRLPSNRLNAHSSLTVQTICPVSGPAVLKLHVYLATALRLSPNPTQ